MINLEDRKDGVSGMLRVRNDAEFLYACVESCIHALDELIIVYNDCTDNSPEIIEQLRLKYADKIKSYHYEHKIYAWNLSEQQVSDIFSGKIKQTNTLAGYYNFALSKTTYKYVMKIDADQIYFPDKLKYICDCYRRNTISSVNSISKRIVDMFYRKAFAFCFRFSSKILKVPKFIVSNSFKNKYYKNAIQQIKINKANCCLYGVNIFYNGNVNVSLGGKTLGDSPNIMVPYNGGGDHPIFKVTNKTKFISIKDNSYNSFNKLGMSVIERLVGIGSIRKGQLLIMGACWYHLNANRINIIKKNKDNYCNNPDLYIEIKKFIKHRLRFLIKNYGMSDLSDWVLFDYIHGMRGDYDIKSIGIINKYKSQIYPLEN